MREPLIIKPQESSIADVFNTVIKESMAHPPAEAALKGREAAYYQSKIDEANLAKAAQANQQSAMAQIMQQHLQNGNAVVPWTNPDTGAVVPNTNVNAPLENQAQRTARIQPIIGQAMLAGDKDAASRFRDALGATLAVGSPDEARQSMVVGGHNIDPNFAPTQAEGDRIRQRNADIQMQDDITKAQSIPKTDSQVKGDLLQKYAPQLSNRQIATVIDANKGSGLSMSMGPDGTATMSTGGGAGNFQPGDFGGPAAGTAPVNPLGPTTTATLSTQQGKTLQNQALIDQIMAHAKMVAAAPDSSFGPAGKGQLLAGDAATAGSGLVQLMASMGLKGSAAADYLQKTRDAALKNGASEDTIKQIFNGNPDIMALQYSADGLKGPVAQALAGMDGGRAAPSEYLKEAGKLIEDPTDLGSGKVRSLTALQTLAHTLAGNSNVYGGARKTNIGRLPIDDLVDASIPKNPGSAVAQPDTFRSSSMPLSNAPAAVVNQGAAQNPDIAAALPPPSPQGALNTHLQNFTASTPAAPSAPAGPIQVKTRADVAALPPGAQFIDPYGVTRVKPNVSVPGGAVPDGSAPVQGGGQY